MGCGASKPSSEVRTANGNQNVVAPSEATANPTSSGPKTLGLQDSPVVVRPGHHVSLAAVSLAFLRWFVQEHSIHERQLTTAQLVTELVKPATAAAKCRYTDLMLGDPALRDAVSRGRPFYFISHVWSRPFTETLVMVDHHFRPEQQRLWRRAPDGQPLPPLPPEEVFVWFDMFAINQHQALAADDSDLAALWEAVGDATSTLMVLDAEGSLLTRIWCLYEAWQSRRAGDGKLRLLSYGIDVKALEQVFIALDVSCAQATVDADRVRILDDIRRDLPGGLPAMTHALKDALVTASIAQVPDLALDMDPTDLLAADPANPAGLSRRTDGDGRGEQGTGGGGNANWAGAATDAYLFTAARLCLIYGRLDHAEALHRRALRVKERDLGPDNADTLDSVNNLAIVLGHAGRLQEAEALQRRALEGRERCFGPDHPRTLHSVNGLGVLLRAQGRLDEAEGLLVRALEGQERVLGPEDPATLQAVLNLGNVFVSRGRLREAEALFRRAAEGNERRLGAAHRDTLVAVNNLATALRLQGKLEEAEPMHQRLLEASEQVLGADHLDTLMALINYGELLQALQRYDEAEEVCGRAATRAEAVLGPTHPTTLAAVNSLANLLMARDKMEGAEKLYRRVLSAREELLGPSHPETLTSANNLANVLNLGGKLEVAEPLYRRALEGQEETLGPGHADTLATVLNLAVLLSNRGKLEEAERLSRRALAGREEVLGPEHPVTLTTASYLAMLLCRLDRLEEAKELAWRALRGMQKVLGPEHPNARIAARNVAEVLRRQGRTDEARALLEELVASRPLEQPQQ